MKTKQLDASTISSKLVTLRYELPGTTLSYSNGNQKENIELRLCDILDDLDSAFCIHASSIIFGLQLTRDIIVDLEHIVDRLAYSFDEMEEDTFRIDASLIARILGCIARLYQLVTEYFQTVEQKQELMDAYLDWAIASKRAERISDCFHAHMLRMELDPTLKETEALRLLGYTPADCLQQRNRHGSSWGGIFELDATSKQDGKYTPSKDACRLGQDIRNIFIQSGFNFYNCRQLLLHAKLLESCENVNNQIFSAQGFFDQRFDIFSLWSSYTSMTKLHVLSKLFLFGLAVSYQMALETLGLDTINKLFQAKMIRSSPACAIHIIGEVQVFPISPADLLIHEDLMDTCFFMTDWPLESLRSRESAVMSVGIDSLELMSLVGGWIIKCPGRHEKLRILDLCCGCGIQGIFALHTASTSYSVAHETVCFDINDRACHFVAANIALNALGSGNKQGCQIYALQHDIIPSSSMLSTPWFETVNCIISNPPFVAVPNSHVASLKPSQYAIGGGNNGMNVFKSIIRDAANMLQCNQNCVLLMVTELPNIEQSDKYIEELLLIYSGKEFRIRIAYVDEDVEMIDTYDHARSSENGVSHSFIRSPVIPDPIVRNRALALLSIAKGKEMDAFRVHKLERRWDSINAAETADQLSKNMIPPDIEEEDLFLTKNGVQFMREHLIPVSNIHYSTDR